MFFFCDLIVIDYYFMNTLNIKLKNKIIPYVENFVKRKHTGVWKDTLYCSVDVYFYGEQNDSNICCNVLPNLVCVHVFIN